MTPIQYAIARVLKGGESKDIPPASSPVPPVQPSPAKTAVATPTRERIPELNYPWDKDVPDKRAPRTVLPMHVSIEPLPSLREINRRTDYEAKAAENRRMAQIEAAFESDAIRSAIRFRDPGGPVEWESAVWNEGAPRRRVRSAA